MVASERPADWRARVDDESRVGDGHRLRRRHDTLIRQETADEPDVPPEANALHASDVRETALHTQRDDSRVGPDEGCVGIHVVVADVPRGSLQVGEEGVAEGERQHAAERRAVGREPERIGSAERLIGDDLHARAGAVAKSSLYPGRNG